MQPIQPTNLPAAAVPLSLGMRAGDFLYVSGQVPTGPDGSILIGDFPAEVNGALDNVEAVLRAAGGSLANLVKVNAYLSNAALFAPFNEVYVKRVASPPPARTTVVVDFGHPDVRVEIDAVAYLGK
ncbi:MAG: 2-iminobutanoate/2-iminopropanoate deaminase [Solirubrobacteraceae bacterium]|nr:2-iminobutanoate/2-iminopropanoate deaminase [Solirubrobacteraceae bacterium]